MAIGYLEVVDLLREYIRGAIDLTTYRDRMVEMRLSHETDSNAVKLLKKMELRYADFSGASLEEVILKKELQKLWSPLNLEVLSPTVEIEGVSTISPSYYLEDTKQNGHSSYNMDLQMARCA
jgi:hypothetical protein